MPKFIITLNNGLKFTSYELPKDDGNSITFHDRDGLYKSFSKTRYEPSIEEVRET